MRSLEAILAVQQQSVGEPAELQSRDETLKACWSARSKAEKQSEWAELPLREGDDLVAWFEEKSQQQEPEQPRGSSSSRRSAPTPSYRTGVALGAVRSPESPPPDVGQPRSRAFLGGLEIATFR